MQRFTIKVSYQPGRKLGLVLLDSLLEPAEVDEGMAMVIRGGGSTIQIDESDGANDEDEENEGAPPNDDPISGLSLQEDFEAEAVAARSPPARVNKRKRPTTLRLSSNSIVLHFAKLLLAKSSSLEAANTGAGSSPQQQTSNLDTLIEWGRSNLPPMDFRNGFVTLSAINDEVLKFAMAGTIKAGDIVERIQYTRLAPYSTMARVVQPTTKSYNRKRRCKPYYRSDHYTTLLCENKTASEVGDILRSAESYPLYLTFKRQMPVSDADQRSEGNPPPPRKRLKRSDSNIRPTINGVSTNKQQSDEVICLLDSSDEEEGAVENDEKLVNGGNVSDHMEIDSPSNSSSPLPHPQFAPPDPPHVLFDDDDFVLTPYGPGKILSSRVERNASFDIRSGATIWKPTIFYSIDLHYGICHVPASSVRPIAGTPYTEKTLITYQRVPLNGHDLLRLRPMTYLNDSLVNFYMKYLKAQFDLNNEGKKISQGRGWDDLDGEGIHIFPSFCYTRIKNIMGPGNSRNSKLVRSKIWKDLASWTKNVDIFKKKLICFPINEHLHWTVVFVCHPGRLVRRYAKDLAGRKDNVIDLESTKTGSDDATQATKS